MQYVLAGLLLLVGGALPLFWFLHRREARRVEAARVDAHRLERDEDARRRKQDREVAVVDLSQAKHDCYATDTLVTCYVTSFAEHPVTTCMQGIVQQKEAAGVRLYSMPLCSGAVQPHQTLSVSAPWAGGRAKDLCQNARGYLDWDKCDFKVIAYEPGAQ